MIKCSAFFLSIVLATSCSLEAGDGFVGSSPVQSSFLNQKDSYISKVLDISNYFLSSLRNLKVFVESRADVRLYSLMEPLSVPSSSQIPSKYRAAKLFEMGMNMSLNQKFSWGAEVAVGKYKNNLTPDIQQKRPLAGLRLKPDLYTFQISLKYKI